MFGDRSWTRHGSWQNFICNISIILSRWYSSILLTVFMILLTIITSWSMLYVHVLHCYFSQAAIRAHKHERTGASVSHCWLSPSDRGGFRTEKCHWASFKGRSLSKPHSLAQAFLPSSFNQNWTAGRPENWASYVLLLSALATRNLLYPRAWIFKIYQMKQSYHKWLYKRSYSLCLVSKRKEEKERIRNWKWRFCRR